MNKSLLHYLCTGNHGIVDIKITEIFENLILQYKSYNTKILYDYTIISVKNCQDGEKRALSWRFISTFFQHYPLTVYQDKS